MKRLDLIVSERELDSVIKALDKAGAPGYSVIKHVTGRGPESSVSEGMDFSGLGANAHVIVFCESPVLERLREMVNPILDYYGGVAYVAEASPM
ncbi:MAG: transcriptional regulator [Prochlorococcus sp.]|nr:transcriptional regulator [Prochlorococcaceae cyanobacterium Fu_MAG_50]